MTDTLVLVWSGKYFESSSNFTTGGSRHLIGTNITVNWGDGTTGTITSEQRFTHTYSNDGTYTIIITGDSITRLGNYCFNYCTGLKKIIIPSSVSVISSFSFSGCSGLQQLVFTRNVPPTVPSSTALNNGIPTSCKIYVPNSSYTSASNYPSSSTYTYIEQDTTEMAKAAIIVKEMCNKKYPVGSIYMSYGSTNPSELFGGAWTQIKDRFLLASADAYSGNGFSGGEATHTLTINEMPSHNHLENNVPNFIDNRVTSSSKYNVADVRISASTQNAGGGQAHNNMPPYLVVSIWERVA